MAKNAFYHTDEYKEKQRIKKLGRKNPNWKGGHSYTYYRKIYVPIMKTLKQQCCMCGTNKKLIAHYLDGNYKNNNLSNISIVCRGCHNIIHKSKKTIKIGA
jgi:endo-alpha-1,4-polygalactosaminidase (GH114 family)